MLGGQNSKAATNFNYLLFGILSHISKGKWFFSEVHILLLIKYIAIGFTFFSIINFFLKFLSTLFCGEFVIYLWILIRFIS